MYPMRMKARATVSLSHPLSWPPAASPPQVAAERLGGLIQRMDDEVEGGLRGLLAFLPLPGPASPPSLSPCPPHLSPPATDPNANVDTKAEMNANACPDCGSTPASAAQGHTDLLGGDMTGEDAGVEGNGTAGHEGEDTKEECEEGGEGLRICSACLARWRDAESETSRRRRMRRWRSAKRRSRRKGGKLDGERDKEKSGLISFPRILSGE